jgi:serine/threonine protein phosphatase PrpC
MRGQEADVNLGGWSTAGRRPVNEDAHFIADLSPHADALGGLQAFLAVSDGMGGHAAGDVASRTAVEAAKTYIGELLRMAEGATLQVSPEVALTEIITEANRAVTAAAAAAGGNNMGATMTAALVGRDHVWVGHAGDSRAYVLRGGEAYRVTTDHSRVGRMIAEGVLTEAEGQRHPDRHMIDNALGFDSMHVEVSDFALEPGDAVLLCTDGVHSVLSDQAILAQASRAKSASEAARVVGRAALAAASDDNITTVVWTEDWSAFAAGVPATVRSAALGAPASRIRARVVGLRRRTILTVVVVVLVLALAGVGAWWALASSGGTAQTPTEATGEGVGAGVLGAEGTVEVLTTTTTLDVPITVLGGADPVAPPSGGTTTTKLKPKRLPTPATSVTPK